MTVILIVISALGTIPRRSDLVLIFLKKERELAVSNRWTTDLKENKKIDQYLDLVRELKKQWNMRMTVILIVISALETVPKSLEKKIWGTENEKNNRDVQHF